mgnify:CR=1 FL=1
MARGRGIAPRRSVAPRHGIAVEEDDDSSDDMDVAGGHFYAYEDVDAMLEESSDDDVPPLVDAEPEQGSALDLRAGQDTFAQFLASPPESEEEDEEPAQAVAYYEFTLGGTTHTRAM